MLSPVLNHGPNTTHLADISILDYPAQVYGLSTEGVVTHHLIIPVTISSKTESTDFAPKVRYLAPTSVKIPIQCVHFEILVQNDHMAQIQFSYKTCQIGKTGFKTISKIFLIYEVSRINSSDRFLLKLI